MTTAASILVAAAVGISVALQQWILAIGVALLVLVILRGLGLVEPGLVKKAKPSQQHSSEE